jgi:hypothetical protein
MLGAQGGVSHYNIIRQIVPDVHDSVTKKLASKAEVIIGLTNL